MRRNGEIGETPEAEKYCSVEGCGARAHGQGLCNKHLQRLRRTGTVEGGRTYPQRANLLTQHELYPLWNEFKRPKNKRPVAPEWLDDFAKFALEVGGERPSKRHRLYQVDKTKPLGPTNFEWREALVEKQPGETDADYDARHRRAKREFTGSGYWEGDLKRRYGLTKADVARMAEEQNHCCAICGTPEKEMRNGITRHLAVDHDHGTGAIRGLLCQSCNTGLGKFRDDPLILARAIAYLAKHKDAS
jgi:hypothetical protein